MEAKTKIEEKIRGEWREKQKEIVMKEPKTNFYVVRQLYI